MFLLTDLPRWLTVVLFLGQNDSQTDRHNDGQDDCCTQTGHFQTARCTTNRHYYYDNRR